ncbi:helix-turn-helix domain-containing protein [Fluviicola taffensis]|uniref:Helix-turn-helix domain protein n=1 Tax=Fluviicola taffensis (strain DSM 16823 / NCIMB 13979 / RW262) TaxID=755732 RepID=F2IJ96_FLUTR|nr:helix-turn-helix transcriptional regulator [Fluviicola taffensis]AEA44966.1 helix-turn-helix domain protein [Fluviicola taffensis DSM 16823]
MSSSIDTLKFSEMIKSKRGNTGLRQLSSEIMVSPSTLSRIEQGSLPDIETYLKICNWLEVSPEFFTVHSENRDEKNVVIAHLRADTSLPSATAEALIQMINIAYASVEKELI